MDPIFATVFIAGLVVGLIISMVSTAIYSDRVYRLYYDTIWFSIDPKHELTASRSLRAIRGLRIRCYPPMSELKTKEPWEAEASVVVVTVRLNKWFNRDERTPEQFLESLMGIMKAKEIKVIDYGCY